MSIIDLYDLRLKEDKPAYTIGSWKPRFHDDIVQRDRKTYQIVEKINFFSYLTTPYKGHAHRGAPFLTDGWIGPDGLT